MVRKVLKRVIWPLLFGPPSYGLFTRGMRLENDIFWQISNLTTLMTLNWSGNIGKHLATPKYPHLDPKSNKIGLSGGILALWMHLKSMSTLGVNNMKIGFSPFYHSSLINRCSESTGLRKNPKVTSKSWDSNLSFDTYWYHVVEKLQLLQRLVKKDKIWQICEGL